MKIVIQRSLQSSITVKKQIIAEIPHGMVLLICFEKEDTLETIKQAVTKIGNLRIFEDSESGKMSNDIRQNHGQFLAISQFTLSWDGRKGNRPGFERSMKPQKASSFFDVFCENLQIFAPVRKGIFAAEMQVDIKNDGPVTFCLNF